MTNDSNNYSTAQAAGQVPLGGFRGFYCNKTRTYEYHIEDHLGNVRVAFEPENNNKITQKNDYYPFGMKMQTTLFEQPGTNKYTYNSKEMQDDFGLDWLDYGARFYDAEIGRWHVADPLAEDYYGWSPYRYGFNSPINFIDPDGKLEDWFVNSKNGNVMYLKGESELTEEHVKRYGEGWENFGPDDMFGDEIIVEWSDGETENILERVDYVFGPTKGEGFMNEQGYEKGERTQMEVTEFETTIYDDGNFGGRTITHSSEVPVGDTEITYAKPDEFGKKQTIRTNSHRDENQSYYTERYSVVNKPGTAVKQSYINPVQVIIDLLGIGGNISSNKFD